MEKALKTARDRWLREEIAARVNDIRENLDGTVSLDDAFSRIKARHEALKTR